MLKELHQGDVLKVERLGAPVLVVSQALNISDTIQGIFDYL